MFNKQGPFSKLVGKSILKHVTLSKFGNKYTPGIRL